MKELNVMVKENKDIEEVRKAFTEETLVEDAALVDSLMSPILDPDQSIHANN